MTNKSNSSLQLKKKTDSFHYENKRYILLKRQKEQVFSQKRKKNILKYVHVNINEVLLVQNQCGEGGKKTEKKNTTRGREGFQRGHWRHEIKSRNSGSKI